MPVLPLSHSKNSIFCHLSVFAVGAFDFLAGLLSLVLLRLEVFIAVSTFLELDFDTPWANQHIMDDMKDRRRATEKAIRIWRETIRRKSHSSSALIAAAGISNDDAVSNSEPYPTPSWESSDNVGEASHAPSILVTDCSDMCRRSVKLRKPLRRPPSLVASDTTEVSGSEEDFEAGSPGRQRLTVPTEMVNFDEEKRLPDLIRGKELESEAIFTLWL